MAMIDNHWVLFQTNRQSYGIQTRYVIEMIPLGRTQRVPRSPDAVRGVVNLRGEVFPVVDLRRWLGMKSRLEDVAELSDMLELRRQDHVNWLNELRASVEEEREFTLTTDPHQCAFGRWYDSFTTEHMSLRHALVRFKGPHAAVHRTAVVVRKLMSQGDKSGALALIQNTWDHELRAMVNLFADTTRIIREETNEIIIVVRLDGRKFGVAVDDVIGVAVIDESQIAPADSVGELRADYLHGVFKGKGDNCLLMALPAMANGGW